MKIDGLDESFFGRCYSDKDVASYLKVEVRLVRKHFEMLGGFRLGKKYIFLEKGLRDALQAKIRGLDGCGHGVRGEAAASLQDEEGGVGMGSRRAQVGAEEGSLVFPF